jgi:hypothetical protein
MPDSYGPQMVEPVFEELVVQKRPASTVSASLMKAASRRGQVHGLAFDLMDAPIGLHRFSNSADCFFDSSTMLSLELLGIHADHSSPGRYPDMREM